MRSLSVTKMIHANVPKVVPVPTELTQGDGEVRAWRLASGKPVLSDRDGNVEQINRPIPK